MFFSSGFFLYRVCCIVTRFVPHILYIVILVPHIMLRIPVVPHISYGDPSCTAHFHQGSSRTARSTQGRLSARRSDTTAARLAEVGQRWCHCLHSWKACVWQRERKAAEEDGARRAQRSVGEQRIKSVGEAARARRRRRMRRRRTRGAGGG